MKTAKILAILVLGLALVGRVGNANAVEINAAQATRENVLYHEDFSDVQAQGWELADGWNVEEYSKGKWALHGRGHRWVSYMTTGWGDYTFKFKLKLVRGGIHLNYRVHHVISQPWRYFIGFNDENLSLNKSISEGQHPELCCIHERHQYGRWYEVAIVGKGNKLTIYVDGERKISYVDKEPILYGKIAFETLDDSEAYITDVTIVGKAPRSQTTGVIVDSQGKVGIGTTDPQDLLHVEGKVRAWNAVLYYTESSNSNPAVLFNCYDEGGDKYIGSDSAFAIWHDIETDTLKIVAAPPGTAGQELELFTDSIDIDWLGNVGIGMPPSTAKLNVNGSIDVAGGISAGSYAWVNPPPENGMIISGNVGIGTTSPDEKLEVIGNIKANNVGTSDITFQKDGEKLWRMFEDEDGLYLESLKTGKVYRFVLQEVDK